MKKYIKYISALLLAMICCMPIVVSAEPEEDQPAVSIDSFIINSNENDKINATMKTSADTDIRYSYTVSVVTDISQDGQKVASGSGTTGKDQDINIDMSDINTYSEYRFKIVLTYTVDGEEEFATAFSKPFEFIQDTFSEDLSGKQLTVNMTSREITIDWSRYMKYGGDAVLVTIEVDGEKEVEELVYSSDQKFYDYHFEETAKVVNITLKQAIDGKLSEGIKATVNLVKDESSKEFYLIFPADSEQFNRTWNIQYRNGSDTQVIWKTDKDRTTLKLTDAGTFLVEMEETNKSLYIEYKDENDVTWIYDFATDVAAYAPDINMLESYNGSTVQSSSVVLVGKISDKAATITLNGNAAEVDTDGIFQGEVKLEDGKNVITIEATSSVGKTARKTIIVYKESTKLVEEVGNIFNEYMPLIITLGVSMVFIVVLIFAAKRKEIPTKNS